MINSLILFIVVLAIIGVVVWFMGKVPIPAPISYIIYAMIAIFAILILASGLDGGHFVLPIYK